MATDQEKMSRLLEMARPPGQGSCWKPLIVGDEDFSEVEGLPKFGVDFYFSSAEDVQYFDTARSRQAFDPEDGSMIVELRPWNALKLLIERDMIKDAVLPRIEGLNNITAFKLSDYKTDKQKVLACKEFLGMSIVRAIVVMASEFYSENSEVESDLKNLLTKSGEPETAELV